MGTYWNSQPEPGEALVDNSGCPSVGRPYMVPPQEAASGRGGSLGGQSCLAFLPPTVVGMSGWRKVVARSLVASKGLLSLPLLLLLDWLVQRRGARGDLESLWHLGPMSVILWSGGGVGQSLWTNRTIKC